MKKYIYLLILSFFSSSVAAEGWYAGAGYLKSETNIHEYPTLTYTDYDDKDHGFTIFVGYDVNERFAVEVGYNDLGETEATISDSGGLTADHDTQVLTLAGLIKSDPIAEKATIFVKAGLARIKDEEDISGASTSSSSRTDTNPFFGFGVDFEMSNGLIVRGLYENYGENDGLTDVNSTENTPDQIDPSTLSLSLLKRF
ncbi:porin family protein [Candidatus Pelagibacter sp.]|nr:porin family protein [Candidatus Pelagibacter sp.]